MGQSSKQLKRQNPSDSALSHALEYPSALTLARGKGLFLHKKVMTEDVLMFAYPEQCVAL